MKVRYLPFKVLSTHAAGYFLLSVTQSKVLCCMREGRLAAPEMKDKVQYCTLQCACDVPPYSESKSSIKIDVRMYTTVSEQLGSTAAPRKPIRAPRQFRHCSLKLLEAGYPPVALLPRPVYVLYHHVQLYYGVEGIPNVSVELYHGSRHIDDDVELSDLHFNAIYSGLHLYLCYQTRSARRSTLTVDGKRPTY